MIALAGRNLHFWEVYPLLILSIYFCASSYFSSWAYFPWTFHEDQTSVLFGFVLLWETRKLGFHVFCKYCLSIPFSASILFSISFFNVNDINSRICTEPLVVLQHCSVSPDTCKNFTFLFHICITRAFRPLLSWIKWWAPKKQWNFMLFPNKSLI